MHFNILHSSAFILLETYIENVISYLTSTASSMTVISVLHLAEGLMASSAGGMTKLLLSGSHMPSPRVYVNLTHKKAQ